jgi:drug/metabolite transporter (DMT)-like permease
VFRRAPVLKEPASSTRAVQLARLYLTLAALLWSLAGVFIKFLSVPPLALVFYRSFFAAIFFVFFVRKSLAVRPRVLLLSMISYTGAISLFVSANRLTTAANAIILQYTAPIFVFAAAYFVFRERISGPSWSALLLGMAGIAVIFAGSAGEPDFLGVTLAVGSGFLFAIYMLGVRLLTEVNAGTLTFLNNVACCVLLFPFVFDQLSLSMNEGGLLALMGVVQLGIPYWLFSKALETVSIHEASLIVLIEPVLNPIWVALAVGEVPSAVTVIGGGLIIAGLAVRYGWAMMISKAEAKVEDREKLEQG